VKAADVIRMIDVLKSTWIYKLRSKEERYDADFTFSDIKDVIYEEDCNVPTILVILNDGTRRVGHPTEYRMAELEALTTWAENLRGRNPV